MLLFLANRMQLRFRKETAEYIGDTCFTDWKLWGFVPWSISEIEHNIAPIRAVINEGGSVNKQRGVWSGGTRDWTKTSRLAGRLLFQLQLHFWMARKLRLLFACGISWTGIHSKDAVQDFLLVKRCYSSSKNHSLLRYYSHLGRSWTWVEFANMQNAP